MSTFIDRRKNPKGKSSGNQRRLKKRVRKRLRAVVDKAIKGKKLGDTVGEEKVKIPVKDSDVGEPTLHKSRKGGKRKIILTGNKELVRGDRIKKPESGAGGGGKDATDSGEGEDEFAFVLTRDEFLDIFFEDLELPDLVKTTLKDITETRRQHAGIVSDGSPSNLHTPRTMQQSMGRRKALKRPSASEIADLENEIQELEARLEASPADDLLVEQLASELALLRERLEEKIRRSKRIPFIDPVDLRFSHYEQVPNPNTKAVMFCLMDVSGSMGEREKDLAKRFFLLLYLFLERKYEKIEIVFIRHTHEAKEVDENEFFHSRETGGTVVSTALIEMLKIIKDRYPSSDWNIYAAQASDGENYSGDSEKCSTLLNEEIMSLLQYFAYVEILDEREIVLFATAAGGGALWKEYQGVEHQWPNFATKQVSERGDIYPVFRELFSKRKAAA